MVDENSTNTTVDWDIVGKIMSKNIRYKILLLLKDNKLTPSQLRDEIDVSMSYISNELRSLRNKNLVKCINPDLKKGRIYKITDKGLKTIEKAVELKEK